MKKYILIALTLILTVGTMDVSAQSFLKQMERTIKKEVKSRVKSEIKKEVKKAVNKGIDSVTEEQSQNRTKTQRSQSNSSQTKSSTKSNENKASTTTNSTGAATTPISKMDTWRLGVKDGKPHYDFIDCPTADKENYYLENIKYEHPNGVKPFMFTTAIATFKAKEGYHFDKSLKLNEYKAAAENTTGFKIVDKQTVKVYLTAFTSDMGHNVKITEAMKEYKKRVSEMNITPIATAKINAPLFDHWDLKLKRRSFEFNEKFVKDFIKKNMRAFYQYPTTEESRDTEGNMVQGGKKTSYPSEYKILSIDILDDDLSDDIPGLVGEWCLISKNQFIPKACLKDIKYGAKYEGAPAKLINSPFEFAGGSGTIEDPYLVQTAEQLNAVRQGPKNHYKLIADIDLSKWGNWIPIGGTDAYGFLGGGWNKAEKGAYSFQGSFDGNGHVISGMQIIINEETPFLTEGGNWRAYGLFASLATNPDSYKIKNLGVVNFNIDVNYTNIKKGLDLYVSAICGGMNNGTDIFNCYSKGGRISIKVKGNEAFAGFNEYYERPSGTPQVNVHIGGICSSGGGVFGGQNNPRKTKMHIQKCFNDSHITVDIQNSEFNIYAGGIIGSMDTSHIHECYNSGNITLPLGLDNLIGSPHESMGAGICSFASIPEIPGIYHATSEGASFIQNCYNTGQIIARSASGIFNFSASDIHLENCYNTGIMIGNEFDCSNGQSTINTIFSKACAIKRFETEYVRKCYGDGNSVSGSAWKTSPTLKRKVLASIPEDDHPSNIYNNVEAKNIGTFTDVKAGVWYGDALQWALDKEIVSAAATFSPDKNCTRGEFLTLLWRAAGSPKMSADNPFSDVKTTDSYYEAALWAKEQGMISGNTFAANTQFTREELVVNLWKNAGCPDALQANQYLDIANLQSELGKAASWAFMNSIMAGTAEYKFSPSTKCTRAQVITFLHRAMK